MKYLIIFSLMLAIMASGCTAEPQTTTTTLPASVSDVAAIDKLVSDANNIANAQNELGADNLDDMDGALSGIETI